MPLVSAQIVVAEAGHVQAVTSGGEEAAELAQLALVGTNSVLATVGSQLAAMGVRLESTLQPLELPDSVTSVGVRLPSTVLLRRDAESVVRQSNGGVQGVVESSLTYATANNVGPSARGTTMVHRLVWAVVGTRAGISTTSGLLQMLWLVDARSQRVLLELVVPAAAPAAGATPAG